MRKIIFQLLLRWFIRQSREVVKLDAVKELYWWRFQDSDHTVALAKHLMTSYTLQYFEAQSELERNVLKGSALAMRMLIEGNKIAEDIFLKEDDDDKRLASWNKYSKILKTIIKK